MLPVLYENGTAQLCCLPAWGSVRVSQVSEASLLHLCSLSLPFSRSDFIPPMWQGWKDHRRTCVCWSLWCTTERAEQQQQPVLVLCGDAWHSSSPKCGVGLRAYIFAGHCHGFKDESKWSFVCCHLAVRHTSCPLLSARISSVGELKGAIRNPAALETVYREQKVPCPLDTIPFTWINNSRCYSSTAWHSGVLLGFL